MAQSDLLFMTATRAAMLIRMRKLSPVEYLEAILSAAHQQQARLNCFAAILDEEARQAARRAEQAVMNGTPLGPLHGVPISIKDLLDVQGTPTRHGSAIFADAAPAAQDDVLVRRLREAGAVIFAKTTTPEFGVKGLTDGPAFGITRNPWNLERTPGGSSGGSAAAVAAGIGPISLGTDGAGSVRGPAACAGLVGLKPTLGAVPYETARDAFGNNVYAGPLARSITDAAIMHAILSGPAPKDPWSQAGQDQHRLSPTLIADDLSGIRLGYIRHCANPRVSRDVQANTDAALKAYEDRGAILEEITDAIDWIELEGRILYQANFTVFCAQYLPRWQNQMDPVTLAFMERGAQYSVADFRNAQFARGRLYRAIQDLLARYDALVMPTTTRTALDVGFDAANDEVEVDGVKCGITRLGWNSALYPFNLTGHPAITIPSGFAADGLPTALQIVGRWGAETDVMRLAAVQETARPWAQLRPPV
jgi:aspartyl-tRNA(Asn)/glutamyl-tRNA(Gln) amidotransferase subunit A